MISTVSQNPLLSIPEHAQNSIRNACENLTIPLPEESLIQLPQVNEIAKSVTTVSVILFQKINEEPFLLMVHQKWKKGNCDFPGGFRAGAPEDKWGKPVKEDTLNEEFFPLLSGSRELAEEVPFLFQEDQPKNKTELTKEVYHFLNQKDTKTLKNSGWDQYPVLMYLRPLLPKQLERASKAMRGELEITNEEVSAISLIAFSAIKQAFESAQWTKNGLEARAKLIEEAAAKNEKADLSLFAQFNTPIILKDINDRNVTISDYTARSIFNSLDQIEQLVKT